MHLSDLLEYLQNLLHDPFLVFKTPLVFHMFFLGFLLTLVFRVHNKFEDWGLPFPRLSLNSFEEKVGRLQ